MNRPKICVPIQAGTQREALDRLDELAREPKVNLAELWLDKIRDLDIPRLLADLPIPTLCVNKKPIDKGDFNGTDEELVAQLIEAAKHGAKKIAVPIERIPGELFTTVRLALNNLLTQTGMPVDLIAEHHDWNQTPSLGELVKLAHKMKREGADIVKMALTPHSALDVAVVHELAKILNRENIWHILISMTDMGSPTRITTPLGFGALMFAPLQLDKATAGGQLTVDELYAAWSALTIEDQ